MNYVGVSCGFHDAAVSIVDDNGTILYAGHAERYSKIKHDKNLNFDIIADALNYTNSDQFQISYYELPWLKYLRQLYAGERPSIKNLSAASIIDKRNVRMFDVDTVKSFPHHLCHAAAGFQTSPFDVATVVTIDAIGEFDTATIYKAWYKDGIAQYKKLWSLKYPNSLGLFYSAMTKFVGLKPLEEEYILMGMSAYGDNKAYPRLLSTFFDGELGLKFTNNLHLGIDDNSFFEYSDNDLAHTTQVILEQLVCKIIGIAKSFNISDNLVYGGGVALNCVANRLLGDYFKNIWIMPNPGDAGSSLGAAALSLGKRLQWQNAFLGHNIQGKYPVDSIVAHLKKHKICGVANGRAEFGPRALGNRSLLADPRGSDIKNLVNDIKKRQQFRPFAPVILEEKVHDYFDMPQNWTNSRYMQTIAICKYPQDFPAIVHVDNSSRVQTVPDDGSGIRQLLEAWYMSTGCPMLLNTSLNIRGEPMVNNESDAQRWQKKYGITVFNK